MSVLMMQPNHTSMPGEVVMSLLSLKHAPSESTATANSSALQSQPHPGKENQAPVASLSQSKQQRSSFVLSSCSPQKHRLLMGRLQASSPSKTTSRSRSAASQPPVEPLLSAHNSTQSTTQQPRRTPSQTGSPTSKGSPSRRIRPVHVITSSCSSSSTADLTTAVAAASSSAQQVLPVPSHSELSAAERATPSPATPPSPADAALLAASSLASQLAQATTPRSPASPASPASPEQQFAPAIQRSSSAPQTPAHSHSANAASSYPSPPAASDVLLAEQLLRARSASSSSATAAASSTAASISHGGFSLSVASLTNSSSQSSCSALSRSSSATAAPSSGGSVSLGVHHSVHAGPSSQQQSSFARLPPRSAPPVCGPHSSVALSLLPTVPLSRRMLLSTPSGKKLICGSPKRTGSGSAGGGFTPVRAHSGSGMRVSVCIKPLEQIRIKASSITSGRDTSTYEFP